MGKNVRMFIVGCVVALAVGTLAGGVARAMFSVPLRDLEVWVPEGLETSSAPAPLLPVRLVIPVLKVDATVQRTGVSQRGSMAVPTSYGDVGWYRYGTLPGEFGSAVMAGHLDNGAGLPAVFAHLRELEAGDDIYVIRADGERVHFVVLGSQSYPYQSVPTQRVFGKGSGAQLNLITCSGEWLPEEETYDERLVVYAAMVLSS